MPGSLLHRKLFSKDPGALMGNEINSCSFESSTLRAPYLTDIRACPGIEVKEHLILLSLPPCCAQSALPYWARVTGTVMNTSPEDKLVAVTVSLLDANARPLEIYTDLVAVDAGEQSSFDVKLKEFRDRTATYKISAKESDPYSSPESS